MQSAIGSLRSGAERVFQNLDTADPIDKGHVEAHFAVLPGGQAGDKFACRGADAGDLPWQQALRGGIEAGSTLDLDKDRDRPVAADHVDLAGSAAPAARQNGHPAPGEFIGDPVLCRGAAQMRRAASQLAPESFSANW